MDFFDGEPARGNKKMERLIAGYWSGRSPPSRLKRGVRHAPEVLSVGLRILERW